MSGLEQLLENLLVPDTAVIQDATKQLKELYKDPKIILEFCALLQHSQNAQVRQYASILLRKKLQKYWNQVTPEDKQGIKVTLMQALINEQVHFVRCSISQLVGEIGKTEIPANQWPEILQLLQEWCMSQEVSQRDIGMSILGIVISEAGTEMETHHSNVLTLCHNLLSDPSKEVRVNVIKCLTYLIPILQEQHGAALKAMVPALIQSVQLLVAEEAETEAQDAMEVFEEVLDSELNPLSPHVSAFLTFTLQIAGNNKLEDNTRTRALSLISWLISCKKKALLKYNLVPDILSVLFPLLATPLNKEEEEITGEETQHPSTAAGQVLDSLSLYLPPDKIFTPSLSILEPLLVSGDVWQRKAGLTALGVMSEGCADHVRNNYLAPALSCACQGLADQNLVVQKAALFALGQFSINLQPDVSKYSGEVLPILIQYLNLTKAREKDEKSWVMRTFYALENTVENLGEEDLDPSLAELCEQQVDTFLPTLMDTLITLLSSAETDSLRELVISCIGATANAAKHKMLPYFQKIMEFFRPILATTPTEDSTLIHAQTIDTLSVLARTVGGEHFVQLSEECINMGLRLLKEVSDPDLRRSVYGLFAAVSVVIGEGLAPKLEEIVTHMIKSLSSSDALESLLNAGEEEEPFTIDEFDEFEVTDEINGGEDDGEDGELNLGMLATYMEELEDTCNALGEIAEHTGQQFIPYFEASFNEMIKMSEHPGEGVRKAAVTTLARLAHSVSEAMKEQGVGDCEKALKKIADSSVPRITSMIRTDSEYTVVLAAIQSLEEMLRFVGKPTVSDGHKVNVITQCIQDVLDKKTICQESDEDDPEEFESLGSELAEVESAIIENAANLIPALGKALGPEAFVEHFKHFSNYIFSRFHANATISERSTMVGVLAECVESLEKCSLHFPNILTVFLEYIKDPDEEVRSNSVFGLGLYAFHALPDVVNQYPAILQAISTLLTPEQDPRVVDNIMAAVARMILASPEHVPLDQTVPVLLSNLPLKKDFQENKTLYDCIAKLVQLASPAILSNLPTLLPILASELTQTSKLTPEERALVVVTVQLLNQNFANEVQQAAASLTPDQLAILQQAASSV